MLYERLSVNKILSSNDRCISEAESQGQNTLRLDFVPRMPDKPSIITNSDENSPRILVAFRILRFVDETDFLAIVLQNMEIGQTVLRPNLLPSEVHCS